MSEDKIRLWLTTTFRKFSVSRKLHCFRMIVTNGCSFTTIDPQRAIGYLQIACACARYDLSDRCKPNYGACVQGKRSVPIELLDVAGLVPGAHEGKGLGNKFLDDLRHADALIHVVDVSGTTDAEGETSLQCMISDSIAGSIRLNDIWLRKGYKRIRPFTRYNMVEVRNSQMDRRELDGEMVCYYTSPARYLLITLKGLH